MASQSAHTTSCARQEGWVQLRMRLVGAAQQAHRPSASASGKKGWRFTLRTMFSIVLVSLLAGLHPLAFSELRIEPVYGVLTGDILAGIGLLILVRHGSSLGGFSVVALITQERLGWRAGYVMMALDACVVAAALLVVPALNVLISAAGVVVLNLVLAFNHRPGRYLGS
nr:YitT family protein [Rathayibacter rathayi]